MWGGRRGYHAAQADVLVVGEDEHHVGPPRLPGRPRRAQHQQRGQRQPPDDGGGGGGGRHGGGGVGRREPVPRAEGTRGGRQPKRRGAARGLAPPPAYDPGERQGGGGEREGSRGPGAATPAGSGALGPALGPPPGWPRPLLSLLSFPRGCPGAVRGGRARGGGCGSSGGCCSAPRTGVNGTRRPPRGPGPGQRVTAPGRGGAALPARQQVQRPRPPRLPPASTTPRGAWRGG